MQSWEQLSRRRKARWIEKGQRPGHVHHEAHYSWLVDKALVCKAIWFEEMKMKCYYGSLGFAVISSCGRTGGPSILRKSSSNSILNLVESTIQLAESDRKGL
jgi:hypothetical protein